MTEGCNDLSGKHITAYIEYMQERGLATDTIKTDLAAIRFGHDALPVTRHSRPLNEELNLERRSFGETDRAWSNDEYNRMVALCRKLEHEDYAAIFTLGPVRRTADSRVLPHRHGHGGR